MFSIKLNIKSTLPDMMYKALHNLSLVVIHLPSSYFLPHTWCYSNIEWLTDLSTSAPLLHTLHTKGWTMSLPLQIILPATPFPYSLLVPVYTSRHSSDITSSKKHSPTPSDGAVFLLWVPWHLCVPLSHLVPHYIEIIYISLFPTRLQPS